MSIQHIYNTIARNNIAFTLAKTYNNLKSQQFYFYMHINQVLNRDMLQARWKWFTLIIYYKRAFVPLKPVNGVQIKLVEFILNFLLQFLYLLPRPKCVLLTL